MSTLLYIFIFCSLLLYIEILWTNSGRKIDIDGVRVNFPDGKSIQHPTGTGITFRSRIRRKTTRNQKPHRRETRDSKTEVVKHCHSRMFVSGIQFLCHPEFSSGSIFFSTRPAISISSLSWNKEPKFKAGNSITKKTN